MASERPGTVVVRLLHNIARLLLSDEDVVVHRTLTRERYITDTDFATLLKLPLPQARRALQRLSNYGLAECRVVRERVKEDELARARTQTQTYWYVNYRRAIDSWRAYLIRADREVESRLTKITSDRAYYCSDSQCGLRFTPLEIGKLLDMETGGLTCVACGSEVLEDDHAEQLSHLRALQNNFQKSFDIVRQAISQAEKFVYPPGISCDPDAIVTREESAMLNERRRHGLTSGHLDMLLLSAHRASTVVRGHGGIGVLNTQLPSRSNQLGAESSQRGREASGEAAEDANESGLLVNEYKVSVDLGEDDPDRIASHRTSVPATEVVEYGGETVEFVDGAAVDDDTGGSGAAGGPGRLSRGLTSHGLPDFASSAQSGTGAGGPPVQPGAISLALQTATSVTAGLGSQSAAQLRDPGEDDDGLESYMQQYYEAMRATENAEDLSAQWQSNMPGESGPGREASASNSASYKSTTAFEEDVEWEDGAETLIGVDATVTVQGVEKAFDDITEDDMAQMTPEEYNTYFAVYEQHFGQDLAIE